MTEKVLREIIGVLMVVLHVALLLSLYVFFLKGGFRFDEFTTSAAIVAPMFAGYTTAITVYFTKKRFVEADESQKVTGMFSAMSIFFPLLLFSGLLATVSLYATSSVFKDFEQFKGTLTLIESVFAGYAANFVYSLFERVEDLSANKDKAAQPSGK